MPPGDPKYMQQPNPAPAPFPFEEHLPQPVEDRKLDLEVATLSSMIEQHVDNYYHTDQIDPADVKNLDDAFPADLDVQRAGGAVAAGQESRGVALRQYISAVALSCIAPDGDPETTFLPKEAVALLGQVQPPREGDPAFSEAYNIWRTLTAYLLRPDPATEPTETAVSRVLALLNSPLVPFAIPDRDADRVKNLRDILRRAAKLGLLLFEQRERWEFYWTRGELSGEVVVFPALVRGTTGEVVRRADVERV
ncbi:hypothetical protein FGG08_000499 [Glutinoglossum americanum]|uniref:Uncharacterized protein n=1 Tax=Glutinoglossum americanum TaxID=1670608 RepID=A0A9P8ID59_9PEZI|nr:hypothetical protein FGG08_000499 [Glutinoglossum americanum]